MPVPSTINDLSTTAYSNSPQGSDAALPQMDDFIRALSAFIAQLRDGKLNASSVSTFMQSVLDDADAATARATLGAVGLTGDQTIAGVKTFSSSPVVPDATANNQAASRGQVVQAAPTAAVMPFALTSAPSGWLKCNGSAVSRSTYSALFAVIGTTFGAGDGSTTFNVPDLRGEFIRGWDDGRGIDTGRSLGSAQTSSIESHAHTLFADNSGSGPNGQVSSLNGGNYVVGGAARIGTLLSTNGSGQALIGSTGGSETRPRNVALLFCIKT